MKWLRDTNLPYRIKAISLLDRVFLSLNNVMTLQKGSYYYKTHFSTFSFEKTFLSLSTSVQFPPFPIFKLKNHLQESIVYKLFARGRHLHFNMKGQEIGFKARLQVFNDLKSKFLVQYKNIQHLTILHLKPSEIELPCKRF